MALEIQAAAGFVAAWKLRGSESPGLEGWG